MPKDSFNRQEADKWISNNGYTVAYGNKGGPHETDKFYRYRQHEPSEYKKFHIKKLPNGVELVIGSK